MIMTKIAHFTTFRTGGAGISAINLNNNLNKVKTFDSKVYSLSGNGLRKKGYQYPFQLLATLIDNYLISKDRNVLFSLTRSLLSSFRILRIKTPVLQDADIIHMHWIPGLIGISTLNKTINKNVILSLHDDYFLTGGCHSNISCEQFKTGCTACPLVRRPFQRLVRYNYNTKRNFYSKNKIKVHAPSVLMLKKARESGLFDKKQIVYAENKTEELAPNLTKKELFDTINICFVANNLFERNKNLKSLITYVKIFNHISSNKIILNLIGEKSLAGAVTILYNKKFLINHGYIKERDRLLTLLSNMDFCIINSISEVSPNVIMESNQQGVPVLCRNFKGASHLVLNGKNGFIYGDYSELTAILNSLFRDSDSYSKLSKSSYYHYEKNNIISKNFLDLGLYNFLTFS